jgi:hypothetical protein
MSRSDKREKCNISTNDSGLRGILLIEINFKTLEIGAN